MIDAPYLKVTLHDNDFTSYYKELGNAILSLFKYVGYPTEEDIEVIKPYIANLWWSMHNIIEPLKWKNTAVDSKPTVFSVFEDNIDVSIIGYADIPKWNNIEDIYIPLFDNAEVICI